MHIIFGITVQFLYFLLANDKVSLNFLEIFKKLQKKISKTPINIIKFKIQGFNYMNNKKNLKKDPNKN